MKWKFMFKFKNNILTLGASDVYIFKNLFRMKAWMSVCFFMSVCHACVDMCVLWDAFSPLFMWVSETVFTCVSEQLWGWGVGGCQHWLRSTVCFTLW